MRGTRRGDALNRRFLKVCRILIDPAALTMREFLPGLSITRRVLNVVNLKNNM
jgi:hypothetical protein